jgi:hypothetical protein
MTEKELAKRLGLENDTEVAFDSRRHFHPILLEHILHLKREYENSHFVIYDDAWIEVIADVDDETDKMSLDVESGVVEPPKPERTIILSMADFKERKRQEILEEIVRKLEPDSVDDALAVS